MPNVDTLPPVAKLPLTGLVAWILPGAGHLLIGERRRGVIILLTIAATFWGGVAIGGVRSTVNPAQKKLWFFAQISGGGHAVLAYLLGVRSRDGLTHDQLADARWGSAEVATVYTGVAGLLNVLAILDALVRVDSPSRRRRPPEFSTAKARSA